MNQLLQDLRFTLRLLLKDKTFNAVALLTLALCIGANTAIFSVVNAVLLQPLPYPEPDRIVEIYNSYPNVGVAKAGAAAPDLPDRLQETELFEEISLHTGRSFDIGVEGSPVRLQSLAITPSFLRVFRINPVIGRAFTEEEGVRGQEKVVMLSHSLWQELYGGSADSIGQDLRLSGVPHSIVGVLPPEFEENFDQRAAVPLTFSEIQLTQRHSNNWTMMARLLPGVPVERAQQRLSARDTLNEELFPDLVDLLHSAGFRTVVSPLQEEMVGDVRSALLILQAAVAFVLLIGCVNVANLLLVRSNVRLKELSVRAALGAGKQRLARLLLTESLVLGLLGGALGLLVGYGGVRLIGLYGEDLLPRANEIHIDTTVMAFTLGIAVIMALIFGAIPLVHVLRANLAQIVRQGGRSGTDSRTTMVTRASLVVAQVSLAFVLLVGSGLLVTSFVKALSVDPGFRAESVVTARFALPNARYDGGSELRSFVDRALRDIRSLPGVNSVGATSYLPFSNDTNSSVILIEGQELGPGELPPVPGRGYVDGDYFAAMGIPLVRGRYIDATDTADSEEVVVIDRYLAEKYWPDGDPIGHQIRNDIEADLPTHTIVGVVGEVKVNDLTNTDPVGVVYYSNQQEPNRSQMLVLRSDRPSLQLAAVLRSTMQRLDPELPLHDVQTMTQRVDDSVGDRRAMVWLASLFGGLALLLSGIGIYGVLAYSVSQRTKEIGIRMALGAEAGTVLRSVAGQGLKLATIGLLVGIGGALFLTRLMESVLYDVAPRDVSVFAGVSLALMGVAVIASLVPSFRATRIDPNSALREE